MLQSPKRFLIIPTEPVLFLAGATFCYVVLIPFAVRYLLDVGSDFEQFITVRDFLRFALRLFEQLPRSVHSRSFLPVWLIISNRWPIGSLRAKSRTPSSQPA